MKKLAVYAAIALMGMIALASCQKLNQNINSKGYSYDVKYEEYSSYGISQEANAVFSDLCQALGCSANGDGKVEYQPSDEAKMAAIRSVQQKYQKNLNSVYLLYTITKVVSSKDEARNETLFAKVEFGDALNNPYAFYKYDSNYTEAKDALTALKGQVDDEAYKSCGRTLLAIKQAFTDTFDRSIDGAPAITRAPWFVSESNDNIARNYAQEIFDQHAQDLMLVNLEYVIKRVGLLDGQEVELWRRTLAANANLE